MSKNKITTWRTVSLGDLITVKHGFAFQGKHFSQLPTQNILLTPGNFQIGGGFKNEKLKYYDGPIPSGYILSPGDLVVSMTDLSKSGDTLGYSALIPSEGKRKFLHNQRIGLVKKKSNEVDLHFLYYLMWTNQYHHYIIGTATGSTIQHTAPERIQNFEFLLPATEEQKRIAEILSAFDEKIENNNRTIKTLEEMAQAIFKECSINVNTEQKVVPLTDLAKFTNGGAFGKIVNRKREGLPLIKIAEFSRGITENTEWINKNVAEKYRVKNGDLLFSWSGTVGLHIWDKGDAILNQHIFNVIPSAPYSKGFLYVVLKFILPFFIQIAGSKATTMGHIQKKHLEEQVINISSSEHLGIFDLIYQKIVTTKNENQKLAAMRDILLPRLISGEIRV